MSNKAVSIMLAIAALSATAANANEAECAGAQTAQAMDWAIADQSQDAVWEAERALDACQRDGTRSCATEAYNLDQAYTQHDADVWIAQSDDAYVQEVC